MTGDRKKRMTRLLRFSVKVVRKKYHYERNHGSDYLVPDGLSFPNQIPELNRKYSYNDKEQLVKKIWTGKNRGYGSRYDCTKASFYKNLENDDAIKFANRRAQWYRKKSLSPMISYLQNILDQYSDLESSIECKNHIMKSIIRK